MDKVYDRVVLATAEYELAPEVAEQLRGDKGEKGADGVGYTDINLQGEELVFHRTDGSDQRVPAPKGKDGKPGRDGVDGAPGKDGVSPPEPNLSVGEVSEGEASATVTGSYPDLKLNLMIPRGATGPKGADAEPLNLAVTASTLAAGSEATAQLSGDYPNLTLALGLPAGAKGDTGVGLPGPKGERGDVTVTQQGMVFGEGFPEGKVTASPGTVYTDTAMTNGAVQWVKKTGTGATGWTVTVGDTGLRKLPPPISGMTDIYLQRVNDTCTMYFPRIGNPSDSSSGFVIPDDTKIFTVPGGFRNLKMNQVSIGRVNSATGQASSKSSEVSIVYVGSQISVRNKNNDAMMWPSAYFSYRVDDLWPSVLPGTPA